MNLMSAMSVHPKSLNNSKTSKHYTHDTNPPNKQPTLYNSQFWSGRLLAVAERLHCTFKKSLWALEYAQCVITEQLYHQNCHCDN